MFFCAVALCRFDVLLIPELDESDITLCRFDVAMKNVNLEQDVSCSFVQTLCVALMYC